MKCKLSEGSTMLLAGVASYSSLKEQENKKKEQNFKFDFDFDFDFDKESFKKDMADFKKDMKAFGQDMKQRYGKSSGAETNSQGSYTWESNFDFNGFGENLSKSIRSMTDSITKNINRNMEHLDENLEAMGDHIDKHVSAMAVKFEEGMPEHWEGNHGADAYDLWSLQALFNDLYETNPNLQAKDLTPKKTYEVSAYELNSSMNDQLTFIGCKIDSMEGLDHKTVVQQLTADQWLLVKMTQEEYSKDWLKRLEALDFLEPYTIEPYFVIHHSRKAKSNDAKEDKIKLSIPLKVK